MRASECVCATQLMAGGGRVELDADIADHSIVARLVRLSEYLTLRDGSIGRGEVVGEQGRG